MFHFPKSHLTLLVASFFSRAEKPKRNKLWKIKCLEKEERKVINEHFCIKVRKQFSLSSLTCFQRKLFNLFISFVWVYNDNLLKALALLAFRILVVFKWNRKLNKNLSANQKLMLPFHFPDSSYAGFNMWKVRGSSEGQAELLGKFERQNKLFAVKTKSFLLVFPKIDSREKKNSLKTTWSFFFLRFCDSKTYQNISSPCRSKKVWWT